MEWLNKFNEKQKYLLGGIVLGIGIICFLFGYLLSYFFIFPAIPLIILGSYIISQAKKESKNENDLNSKPKATTTKIILESEKQAYNDLISNNFCLDDQTSNFDCSLMIMALNQIRENKLFDPKDLPFDIDEKINEISEYGRKIFLSSKCKNFVSVDLETTGLDCETDRIVQISAVKVIDGEIVDIYEELVNPQKHIPKAASEINGICDEDVKNQETIDKILPNFINFIGKSTLVMHNDKFDLSFLRKESIRVYGENEIKNKHLCTMKLWKSRYCEKQQTNASAKLATLVINLLTKSEIQEYYANQHTAACDAVATARVFMKIYDD